MSLPDLSGVCLRKLPILFKCQGSYYVFSGGNNMFLLEL